MLKDSTYEEGGEICEVFLFFYEKVMDGHQILLLLLSKFKWTDELQSPWNQQKPMTFRWFQGE